MFCPVTAWPCAHVQTSSYELSAQRRSLVDPTSCCASRLVCQSRGRQSLLTNQPLLFPHHSVARRLSRHYPKARDLCHPPCPSVIGQETLIPAYCLFLCRLLVLVNETSVAWNPTLRPFLTHSTKTLWPLPFCPHQQGFGPSAFSSIPNMQSFDG